MGIAGDIPGLSIQDLGPGDKKYVIRGINSTGDSTTGVYYGEAVISGSNADDGGGFESDIRLYDMDRIEVLRGPQGTLYGASSMSGTIRFIPKSPDLNTLGGYLTAGGLGDRPRERQLQLQRRGQSAHHRRRAGRCAWLDGNSTTAVTSTRFAWARVSPSSRQRRHGPQTESTKPNRSRHSVYLKGVNDDDVGGGRAIVRFQPTDKLTIDANYTAQTETSGGSSRYTPAGVDGIQPAAPIPPMQGCDLCNTDVTQSPWSDNLKVFGATLTYDTGIGTVTGTTNQYNRRTDFTFDSTPVLVSFDVPVPAETFEPRDSRSEVERDPLRKRLRFSGQLRRGRLSRA